MAAVPPPQVSAAILQQDLRELSVALGASQPPGLTHRQTVSMFLQASSIPLDIALQQAAAYSDMHMQLQEHNDTARGVRKPTVSAQEVNARVGWRGRAVVKEYAARAGIRATGAKNMGPTGLTGRARTKVLPAATDDKLCKNPYSLEPVGYTIAMGTMLNLPPAHRTGNTAMLVITMPALGAYHPYTK